MNPKDRLRELVREELNSVLEEQARNWWHKPAEAEIDAHLKPSDVHEARPGVGKKETGRYTSAGTIPNIHKRKLSKQKIQNRKAIGQKMLNMFRRGSKAGSNIRQTVDDQLFSKGLPINRKHQYSQIWANASDMAAKGATAADVKQGSSSKKKGKSGSKKSSGGNTTP